MPYEYTISSLMIIVPMLVYDTIFQNHLRIMEVTSFFWKVFSVFVELLILLLSSRKLSHAFIVFFCLRCPIMASTTSHVFTKSFHGRGLLFLPNLWSCVSTLKALSHSKTEVSVLVI